MVARRRKGVRVVAGGTGCEESLGGIELIHVWLLNCFAVRIVSVDIVLCALCRCALVSITGCHTLAARAALKPFAALHLLKCPMHVQLCTVEPHGKLSMT